ncbi:MAG TPA: CopD family protein [Candidatus Methylomirabilis sp.]|nr:CopD family protein [Candidatus Methylomirabilis sp.]
MLGLAEFLDTLLRGVVLLGVSLSLGGVAWGWWVLRVLPPGVAALVERRALTLLEAGGIILAVAQALVLALKIVTLSDSLGSDVLRDFAATSNFQAGAARAGLALALAGTARWLRGAPRARFRWAVASALAVLLAASGAWLTHATGRLEHRGALMTLTVFHQAGAAIWLGGLVQLGGLWRLARREPAVDALWPQIVGRFSRLAMVSVGALILAGVPLAWIYTGSLRGLLGTGYGSLVVTKGMLLAVALLLAAFNLAAARRGAEPGPGALRVRLPHLAEAEAIIVVMILFTTSALSAQPPPADVPTTEQATVAEVVEVFRPKLPSLRTPSLEAMRQNREGPEVEGTRSRDAYLWSNFSHNVSGLILLGMSLFALVGFATGGAWGRHWPLGFVALAVFIFLRASANEGTWPFGSAPVALVGSEGIQHRLAALLVLAIGLIEWRARAGPRRGGPLAYVFPVLGAIGGVLLLAHSHSAFELKSSFLVQVTHSTMGAFAGLMVVARWLELRMVAPSRRLAGAAASAAMLVIALILLFYREANIVLPPD